MLSKASLKWIDYIYRGLLVISVYATASLLQPLLQMWWTPPLRNVGWVSVLQTSAVGVCSLLFWPTICSLHSIVGFLVGTLVRHASGWQLLSHRRTFGPWWQACPHLTIPVLPFKIPDKNPSRPGDLFAYPIFTAYNDSSKVNGSSIAAFAVSGILFSAHVAIFHILSALTWSGLISVSYTL